MGRLEEHRQARSGSGNGSGNGKWKWKWKCLLLWLLFYNFPVSYSKKIISIIMFIKLLICYYYNYNDLCCNFVFNKIHLNFGFPFPLPLPLPFPLLLLACRCSSSLPFCQSLECISRKLWEDFKYKVGFWGIAGIYYLIIIHAWRVQYNCMYFWDFKIKSVIRITLARNTNFSIRKKIAGNWHFDVISYPLNYSIKCVY